MRTPDHIKGTRRLRRTHKTRKRLAGAFRILAHLFFLAVFAPCQEPDNLSRPIYAKWQFKTEGITNLTPAIDGEKVYIPLDKGTILGVWLSDGGLAWKSDIGGSISASPVADPRNVYVASESLLSTNSTYPQATGVLRALSRQSGLTTWMRMLPSPVKGIININQDSLFTTSSDGRLYAINKETGEIKWIKYNSSPFNPRHVLSGDDLYVGDGQGDISALELEGGGTIWRYRTHRPLRAPVAVFGNMVYAGTADGFVYGIDRVTGRLKWRVRTGAAVQAVLAEGRCILATSLDNFVYCLSPQRGAKLWKRQLAGRVAAPPLILNDSVLLAPLAGDECVILSLEDGKKTNSVYVGEDNNTEAAPLFMADTLLITTREGLLAFSNRASKE
jgi:outer membrane protein assembly factor BamB